MDVLARIAHLREQRSWTEYRLAEEAGIQQSLISQWYKRELTPSLASVESLCAAFGITLSQFFADGPSTVDLTAEQMRLVESWNALSSSKRKAIQSLIDNLLLPD